MDMNPFILVIIGLIGSLVVLMVWYSLSIQKLMRLLESSHPRELEEMNLGKKRSDWAYSTIPKQGKNVLKFIFSKNHLNDPSLKSLQQKLKTIILLCLLWGVILTLIIILFPKT